MTWNGHQAAHPAMIGDPGHRWMTAVGPFQGNTAKSEYHLEFRDDFRFGVTPGQ